MADYQQRQQEKQSLIFKVADMVCFFAFLPIHLMIFTKRYSDFRIAKRSIDYKPRFTDTIEALFYGLMYSVVIYGFYAVVIWHFVEYFDILNYRSNRELLNKIYIELNADGLR